MNDETQKQKPEAETEAEVVNETETTTQTEATPEAEAEKPAQVEEVKAEETQPQPEAKPQPEEVAQAKPEPKPQPEVAEEITARIGGGPRRITGIVVGNKADKTARVRVERRVKHPLYGKIIRRRGHLQAHDENNKCQIGDVVTVEESPRFSKTKAWRVIEINPGEQR